MAALCEGGNEPPGSLKDRLKKDGPPVNIGFTNAIQATCRNGVAENILGLKLMEEELTITNIRRPEFECSGPQLEGPEFECSGPQLEGPEFEYSELSLKVCGSRYCELE
ncbi:hypothetical protein ANN_01935 [Periplaneta americana]|uniref:Uncharacterized protein n=1 Tax=Periplaneta americana TaxID=6978 RepID=A0ABQ8TUZ8_PERAM|nr:hypothetical protein ANN_01935 [Periplaneta americana]